MAQTAQRFGASPFARTGPDGTAVSVPSEMAQVALPRIAVVGGMTLGLTLLKRIAGATTAVRAARFINLLLASLLAGNGVGAAVAIHPALRSLPPRQFFEAERAITGLYARIMSVVMPAAVVSSINVLRLMKDRRSPAFGLTVAGMANLIGMMVVTGIELPLNRKTLNTSPDDVTDWVASRERWNRFNLIRTALTVQGWALLCLAALSDRKD